MEHRIGYGYRASRFLNQFLLGYNFFCKVHNFVDHKIVNFLLLLCYTTLYQRHTTAQTIPLK